MHDHTLAGARWRKSSRSGGAENCVELALGDAWVAARDSKHPAGPAIVGEPATFAALLRATKAGALDRA